MYFIAETDTAIFFSKVDPTVLKDFFFSFQGFLREDSQEKIHCILMHPIVKFQILNVWKLPYSMVMQCSVYRCGQYICTHL